MSYWDIHEFLAEEEKVEFSISQDAHLIDFLDPTKEGAIPADTTITTAIWLLNTLSDYLDAPNTQIKVSIPEDYRDGMENRYAAFEKARREQFRTTAELPYFYEIYEGLKKTTAHEERKISGEKLGGILEERAKLIISRACGIFEESRADPVTGSYSRFEMGLYKLTRNKALEYHRWKTA